MLTPAKIKNHHFESAGRNSYKADSVDSFLEEVASSYDKMFQENGEMFKKLNLLAERLEEYRKDEDNIRNALLAAQRTAEKIMNDAKEKADEMVAEVTERTTGDHARLDAEIAEKTNEANAQIQAMLSDARVQAQQIIDDATRDSKEAAISARSDMVKEEASLDTMKQEVTKFKKLLLDQYNEQIALVEKLPEFFYEQAKKEEEERAAAEAAAKAEAEAAEAAAKAEAEAAERAAKEAEEAAILAEAEAIAAMSDNVDDSEEIGDVDAVIEEVKEKMEEENAEIDVTKLQMMIAEDEDDEPVYDDDEEDDEPVAPADDAELVLPEVDDASEEYLNKIVDDFKLDDDIVTSNGDIMFTKRTRTDSLDESEAKMKAKVAEMAEAEVVADEEVVDDTAYEEDEEENESDGFSVNVDKIDNYTDDDDDDFLNELDDDDDDDDDDDNGGGFGSKLMGFFKK